MKQSSILAAAAALLILLGIYMIYLGTKGNILPPTITGVGFIIVAIAFLGVRGR